MVGADTRIAAGTRPGHNQPDMGATVLVIDDNEGFRACARHLLETQGFEVLGEAEDATSGIEAARSLRPDIVLLDIHLPDGDGLGAAERIAALNGRSSIVLTSSCDVSDIAGELTRSPARGFIPKSELSGEAIRELLGA
jgi:DNA-binding NarL/FixJ family response regulator